MRKNCIRAMIVAVLLVMTNITSAQHNSAYLFPNKTSGFTQLDWLEILSDISNDSAVLIQMKTYSGKPVVVRNKPYFCYVADSFPIQFQFCPECVWIVDSCKSVSKYSSISMKEVSDYGFVLKNIPSPDEWNTGDTVKYLFFTMCHTSQSRDECHLAAFVSRGWAGAYTIYPSKRKKKK